MILSVNSIFPLTSTQSSDRLFNMNKTSDPEEIIKCGCGLPLRRKNWTDHWRGCRVGSAGPATQEDKEALIYHESQKREWLEKCRKEHDEWLNRNRNKTI
jgi:hypothetical protein